MKAPVPARLRDTSRDRVMITPEGIALPLTLASRGTRAGALMLDLIFIGILMFATTAFLLSLAGGAIGRGLAGEDGGPLAQLLQFLFILWIVAMFLFRNAY